jgi:hypothetical protein
MKIYTEEQLREAIKLIYSLPNKTYSEQIANVLSKLTPIELPSDEEVGEFINTFPYTKHLDDGQYNDGVIYGATIGIDWMRDKIQGGNNE